MKPQPLISGAGNVVVPAYLTLQKMGYTVSCEKASGDGDETWVAENDTVRLSAGDIVMLLGLATIAQERGKGWKASDAEIQDFLKKYGYEDVA